MGRIKSPILRVGVHLILITWILYSTIPFAWTVLTSIKHPVEANRAYPQDHRLCGDGR